MASRVPVLDICVDYALHEIHSTISKRINFPLILMKLGSCTSLLFHCCSLLKLVHKLLPVAHPYVQYFLFLLYPHLISRRFVKFPEHGIYLSKVTLCVVAQHYSVATHCRTKTGLSVILLSACVWSDNLATILISCHVNHLVFHLVFIG